MEDIKSESKSSNSNINNLKEIEEQNYSFFLEYKKLLEVNSLISSQYNDLCEEYRNLKKIVNKSTNAAPELIAKEKKDDYLQRKVSFN